MSYRLNKSCSWLVAGAVISLGACSVSNNAAVSSIEDNITTYARFVPERSDDFAWENDLVAFRAYGPALRDGNENAGVDCWLKRVNYSIIDKWYHLALDKKLSYHQDRGEGLDNYHVGESAGCGSTALWLDGQRAPLETYTQWQIIESYKGKTVFELSYKNQINGDIYEETKRVTIKLGERLYDVESSFKKNGQAADSLSVAVGLTTHDEKAIPAWDKNQGYLLAWETLGEYGLGTAVVVEPQYLQSVQIIKSEGVRDKGHALLIVNTDADGKVRYKSGYGWQAQGVITSKNSWQQYLIGQTF